ncbi:MAG: FMN-binding negative transcriptional regulator [Flavobacteriales bacterium]
MYIPKAFRIEDRQEALAFVQEHPFGVLVSSEEERPLATHLPFVIEEEAGELFLASHWAKANDQWKGLEGKEVLTIFSGPDAYISPSHYDAEESVPTWDHLSVHLYGSLELIESDEEVRELLEKMIRCFEPAYMKQWEHLSERYKSELIPGLKAFRIRVNEVQGQAKLSQDKSAKERERIAEQLTKSSRASERLLALYLKGSLSY